MSSLPTRSRALTGAREKPCGRALSPSKNWQTSVRRFGRSSDNKSTYETRSPSLQAEREDLALYHSQAGGGLFDRNNIPIISWAAAGRSSARAGSIGEQKPVLT